MIPGSIQLSANKGLSRAYSAVAKYRGAVELGWYDFITRFRRSYIGPLWATIQLILWIASLSIILHDALGENFGAYVLYVGLGLYMWEFLSSVLSEGPTHFASQASLIKNVPIDLSYVTIRKVAFLFFRSAFQLPVPIFLIIVFGNVTNPLLLLLLAPVPILLACFSYACLVILGILGAQFRDVPFLMPAIVRFLLFTSPIIWRGDSGIRKVISDYNPFSYFLELVRAPIEGRAPSSFTWLVVCVVSFGGLAAALYIQSAFRNRLIYWL